MLGTNDCTNQKEFLHSDMSRKSYWNPRADSQSFGGRSNCISGSTWNTMTFLKRSTHWQGERVVHVVADRVRHLAAIEGDVQAVLAKSLLTHDRCRCLRFCSDHCCWNMQIRSIFLYIVLRYFAVVDARSTAISDF